MANKSQEPKTKINTAGAGSEKTVAKTSESKTDTIKQKTSNSNKNVMIAVLATALGCLIIAFGVLLSAGVIKFNGDETKTTKNDTSQTNGHKTKPSNGDNRDDGNDDTLIDNPNPKVNVNGTLVQVGELEFYLPNKFEAGGKNDDGAYTYNLTNDDGWAQVLVYAKKSNLSPEKFLMKTNSSLDIADNDYDFNGTEWDVGENATTLAYATKLDETIYAVIYNVKIDSAATGEAMQMIPKTLYMNKIYADDAN